MVGKRRPFMDSVLGEPNSGCWLWMGDTNVYGYGRVKSGIKTRAFGAHRVSWEKHYGPIPKGMHVLHKCDTPACVRPDHLFLGTDLDNVRDMHAKGRQAHPSRHVSQRKLTDTDISNIRTTYAAGGVSQPALARFFNIAPSEVCYIINRKRWKDVPNLRRRIEFGTQA